MSSRMRSAVLIGPSLGSALQATAGDRQGIEYLLTPFGLNLRPVLESLVQRGARHAKELREVHRLLPSDAVVRDRTT
jgi:hypothetical protein